MGPETRRVVLEGVMSGLERVNERHSPTEFSVIDGKGKVRALIYIVPVCHGEAIRAAIEDVRVAHQEMHHAEDN